MLNSPKYERLMVDFVRESNKIEGILREPTKEEVAAHWTVADASDLSVKDLVSFVKVIQPDAVLRNKETIPGVRVGKHIVPKSGPKIEKDLEKLLEDIFDESLTPFEAHVRYETLHPFTDGNGRSGRATWLYQMAHRGQFEIALVRGFLHQFYYQTLDAEQ